MLKQLSFRIALSHGTSSTAPAKTTQSSRAASLSRPIRSFSFIPRQQSRSITVQPFFSKSVSGHKQLLFKDISTSTSTRGFASLPPHTEVGLPALSPSMEKGNIAKWKKKEGDRIKPTDVIAEIETDKATVDFEATEDGYLAKILLPEGTKDIPIGTPIAITVEKKEDLEAFKNYVPAKSAQPTKEAAAPPKEAAPPKAAAPPKQEPPKTEPVQAGKWVPGAPPPPMSGGASYLARATAAQQGVNLASVAGTGPSGRILQADVLEAKQTATTPVVQVEAAPGVSFTDIANTQIRKVIAERLTQSKQQIPHYYLTVDCRIDELAKLRAKLNDKGKGEYKLSVNDFVVKAAALALRKVPEVNSSWMGDSIRRYNTVDINVAVNTDRGLMTPLIRDADKIGLVTINNSVKDMAERAKIGKLSPAELSSGTFTISNLGMFGIKQFAAVINPPQSGILAVGTSEKRVIVNEIGGKENPYTVGEFVSVTLSCDHRVVDGAVGSQWLQKFKEYLEDPTKMLL